MRHTAFSATQASSIVFFKYTYSQKKREKIYSLAFSFYITFSYFSDVNVDSPVDSLSHNLKIMTLRLTLVALTRKNRYSHLHS